MKRRIITIDEEKCNGCGLCADACHEGAIGMVVLVISHEHAEHGHGQMLLLPKEVGRHIGRRAHRHHHTSDVEGEIHHQDGAQQRCV